MRESAADLDYADPAASGWNSLATGDADRDVSAADVLAVTEAESIALAEARRWPDGGEGL